MHFLTKKCCVPECGNISTMGDGCFKAYFEFPSDRTLREQWFNAILMRNDIDMKNVKICDDHFEAESKFTTTNSWKRLKLGSLPSLKLPKYICRTCCKTVDTKREPDKEKQCQCEKPDPCKFPQNSEDVKLKQKEKEERERHEKERLKKEKAKREENRRQEATKKRDEDTRRKERGHHSRDSSSSSSRSSLSTRNDKNRKDESAKPTKLQFGSTSRNHWSTEEKEAILNCIEKYGRPRWTASKILIIEWREVVSNYRDMGFFGNEKEIKTVWRSMKERARRLHEDNEEPSTRLERKVCRFLFGRKSPPRLTRDASPDSDKEKATTSKRGSSKSPPRLTRDASPDSDKKKATTSKRSMKKRSSKSNSSSDQDFEDRPKNKKSKYGTYQIVNDSKHKNRDKENQQSGCKENKKEDDEPHKKENSKVKSEVKDEKRGTHSKIKNRKRIIEILESSESETEKSKMDEDRSSGFGEMDSADNNSECENQAIKSESSDDDEYFTKADAEKFQIMDPKPSVKQEEQKFGIWEIKEEPQTKKEFTDKENLDDVVDLSSDDECLGLEDLKRLGVNVDQILRAVAFNKGVSEKFVVFPKSGYDSDDSQKTVPCPYPTEICGSDEENFSGPRW